MKVAIVHDWLTEIGGAEKVIKELYKCFPNADFYTMVCTLPKEDLTYVFGDNIPQIHTSFLDKYSLFRKRHQKFFFLFPMALEAFDLSEYDLVISSSYAGAKGVLTSPAQTHISYCHSPARYAWDLMHQYLADAGLHKGLKRSLAMFFLTYYRQWDVTASNRVDYYIANSRFVATRIKKYYRRDAEVINPPVSESFTYCTDKKDYYFFASRLVPYKKADVIVEAFKTMPERHVKIAGGGPELQRLQALAEGYENIEIMGRVSDESLDLLMSEARAFLFLALEDFGIVPVEAQMAGTPVIGLNKGGVSETVIDGVTGVLIAQQTPDALKAAIERFEITEFNSEEIRKHAMQYSETAFRNSITDFVDLSMGTTPECSG
jgi:glycosyltransferase involved in cell wall biosynthesis